MCRCVSEGLRSNQGSDSLLFTAVSDQQEPGVGERVHNVDDAWFFTITWGLKQTVEEVAAAIRFQLCNVERRGVSHLEARKLKWGASH